jgi:tetratricopeptide (TPR) repeat protein
MQVLKEAEQICRQLNIVEDLQNILGKQAVVLEAINDLDGAITLLKEKEQICRRSGNLDGLSASLGNQARILKTRGDLQGAKSLLVEAEPVFRKLENKDGLQSCLGDLGVVLMRSSELEGALEVFKKQELICRETNNPDRLAICLADQALVLWMSGRPHEGVPCVKEAIELATDHGYTELASRYEPLLNKLTAFEENVSNRGEADASPMNSNQAIALQANRQGIRIILKRIYGILLAGAVPSAGVLIILRWHWGWIVGIPLLILGVFILTLHILLLRGFIRLVTCPSCGRRDVQWGKSRFVCHHCGNEETS